MINTKMSRRTFIGVTAGAVAGVTAFSWGFSKLRGVLIARAQGTEDSVYLWEMTEKLEVEEKNKYSTICPYCAGGCQIIVYTNDAKKAIDMDGDPDCPINEGTLCSKANGYLQLVNSKQRITKPMKRTAGSKGQNIDPGWAEITWDEAFTTIADKVKAAMDALDIDHDEVLNAGTPEEKTVTNYYSVGIDHNIAMHGSSYFNNEECYLSKKIISLLGSSENEHQARKCHASTVAGLGSTFGFGAMTNHFTDIANARRILIIGSNAAENHPISFHHVQKAVDQGAKIIVLDPRYTRTASRANLFARFRSGTQAAIFMGLMRYVLHEKPERLNEAFLKDRTNAPYKYSEIIENSSTTIADVGLDDAGSVLQQLKELTEDYTAKEVSRITGIEEATFVEVCDLYTEGHTDLVPGTIMYSMGTTQHTNATYGIRAYAMLQLLLGNIGRPGGGVNALRGISNVQGSTDMNLLSHYVMGYRGFPRNMGDVRRYQKWKNSNADDLGGVSGGTTYPDDLTVKTKQWDSRHFPTWNSLEYNWGLFLGTSPGTDPDNEPAICDLPVGSGNATIQLFRKMLNGGYKVGFIFGENNAVSTANSSKIRDSLAACEFLVVYENFDHETAHFADLLLPATFPTERYGTITNSGRWVQWRTKAIDPPNTDPDTKNMPEVEFLTKLFHKIRETGMKTPSEKFMADNVGTDLNVKVDECWPTIYKPYTGTETINDDWLEKTAMMTYREMGADVLDDGVNTSRGRKTSQPAANILHKKSYDSTKTGLDAILAARRSRVQSTEDKTLWKNWAWSWMLNQRVLYDITEENPGVSTFFNWWASTDHVWLGLDRASIWSKPRFNRADAETRFGAADKEKHPLYWGMPLHNEPVEAPVASLATEFPTVWYDEKFTALGYDAVVKGDVSKYPYVMTTFRVTEHMQAGAMTRNVPWLIQCHPECFLEISKELASELGITSGEMITVESARASVQVKASVTGRLKPFTVDGKTVHEVAMPWHWGFKGLSTGPSANDLTIDAVDYHANIPETKVCLCNIKKGV